MLKFSFQSSTGEFDWDEKTQGLLLGFLYYGYAMTQIPGGYMAGKYGGKYLFGGGILLGSVITMFYPLAARTNVALLMGLRGLQGFVEGVITPSLFSINTKWLPKSEQGFLTTIIFSGNSGTDFLSTRT